MKTIVCGPPHSGKSVLIANLIRMMPSDSYLRINANGDGEGSWSNNRDQEEIKESRQKSGNTPEKFVVWANNVRNAFQDVVLVDIGGKLQDDKAALFDAADSFIVLSSNIDVIPDWIAFGEEHGCKCLAVIESQLEGGDEVISEKPYLKAKISGLERGCELTDSAVITALADTIISASGYKRSCFLDFVDIGEAVDAAFEWRTKGGNNISHIHFEANHGPLLYEYLHSLFKSNIRYKVYGLKANWVAALSAICLVKSNSTSSISFFDDRSGGFKDVIMLRKASAEETADYWEIEENEEAIFLKLKSVEYQVDTSSLSLPVIDESKKLFLKGRLPMWVIASIFVSYSSEFQYLFQPGNHYICVKSNDISQLGSHVLV